MIFGNVPNWDLSK